MENIESFGLWSVVPSLVTIGLAIATRRIFLSLLMGVFSGMLIYAEGNLLRGFSLALDKVADVFKSDGNTKTILFTLCVGGLLRLLQTSGGVQGFVSKASAYLNRGQSGSQKKVEGLALLSGMLLFIESNISILTTSTLFRPLFDKFKVSREKLAYISDSGAAPFSILIPFNAWGAFVISLLVAEGLKEQSLDLLIGSIGVNFYPLVALVVLGLTIFLGKEFGPMRHTIAVSQDKAGEVHEPQGNMWNMVVPLLVLVLSMPLFLVYSGWQPQVSLSFWTNVYNAIADGSGASAVLYAVVLSILILMGMMTYQRRVSGFSSDLAQGVLDMVSAATIMMMAFAIGSVCRDLHTGQYVSQIVGEVIPRWCIPASIFVVSSVVSFSTGTSWGTFSIMMPIAIPLAQEMTIPLVMCISAVLGGGVFGDHCSPISDTSVLSSMASKCNHMAHVNTQLPYALVSGGIAVVCYLITMIWA